MSEIYKVSGKKFKLPSLDEGWTIESRPGGWWIAVSPEGTRKRLMAQEYRGFLSVSIMLGDRGCLWHGEIQKETTHGAATGSASDTDLVAQFPGKVRKVLVKNNTEVKEGDPLLLVEAMKMEFPIKAPADCLIVKVLVQENQQLSPGDRFFEIKFPNGDGDEK